MFTRCSIPIMGETVSVRKDTRDEALEYNKYAIGIFKEQQEELV